MAVNPLYEAWLQTAKIGRRIDLLGLTGFRKFVADLPPTATETIITLVAALGVPPSCWRSFLLCELFSIAGWASFVKYRVREAQLSGTPNEDLLGLLAIRLVYDVVLAHVPGASRTLCLWPHDFADDSSVASLPMDVGVQYMLQVATEIAYRRTLTQALGKAPKPGTLAARKTLQMVFCIDVRSEVMRRHLEAVSEGVETFGFAGFFGMALEYVPFGDTTGVAQCPVLLTPSFRIQESLLGASESVQSKVCQSRQSVRQGRKLWKYFQTSAASCFSFVESIGLVYFFNLLTDSLRLTPPVSMADNDGLPDRGDCRLGPQIHRHEGTGLEPVQQIDLAEAMLRNLGLTEGFARIVAVCGHASDVVTILIKQALIAERAAVILGNRRSPRNITTERSSGSTRLERTRHSNPDRHMVRRSGTQSTLIAAWTPGESRSWSCAPRSGCNRPMSSGAASSRT